MSKLAVLDSSAVLAVINRETGFEKAERYLWDGVISSVNAMEIACVLRRNGADADAAETMMRRTIPRILPFAVNQLRSVAELYAATRHVGLSQGDCVCLALGHELKRPVVTMDRRWADIDVGVKVLALR